MSSIPNSYIDDLRSIVLATLNRIEQLRMRVLFGVQFVKGAYGQELEFRSDGKLYLDDVEVGTGGVTDHGALTGLADDDHTQYMPVNASRNFTGDVSIDTATPSLDFAESGSFRGGVYINATDDFVMECELGKIILGTDPTNGDVIEINPKAGGVVATFNSTVITFAQMLAASKVVTGDHGTAATDEVVNVCYGTSATPPTASTTTEGALYIQYMA